MRFCWLNTHNTEQCPAHMKKWPIAASRFGAIATLHLHQNGTIVKKWMEIASVEFFKFILTTRPPHNAYNYIYCYLWYCVWILATVFITCYAKFRSRSVARWDDEKQKNIVFFSIFISHVLEARDCAQRFSFKFWVLNAMRRRFTYCVKTTTEKCFPFKFQMSLTFNPKQ